MAVATAVPAAVKPAAAWEKAKSNEKQRQKADRKEMEPRRITAVLSANFAEMPRTFL
jgi:hypothetical protein